jgi:hypothetical protein
MSHISADLNGLNVRNAHLVFNWLIILEWFNRGKASQTLAPGLMAYWYAIATDDQLDCA